jgi:UDP-N-acetylmuramoyl-L-alanyl-D-glutamate--2,6-diaminopimelate ligase
MNRGADSLFMDNFERFGVTADWQKVLPGMVYVDLQENKSRKEIFNAYHNGASLIFTTHNITNPELPVVKVNNVYETMLLLLNKHFNNPQDKVKLVAISGSNDKDIVLDLLHKILGKEDKALSLNEKNDFYNYFNSLNNMTIEDMYQRLNKIVSTGEHFMPLIVDYKLKYFKFINSFKFDCALITGVNNFDVGDQNSVLSSIRGFVSQIPDNKPIIFNNDDDLVLKALAGSKNNIVISYGLNKKAAVTATSIDLNQQTTFNYCLQRSFTTSNGNHVEPFEVPIRLNILGSRSIYNALAVITCALYYDVDIEQIKTTLIGYAAPSRRFEISDIQGATVLDNYCSSIGDLDKTLEGIQLLNYNKLRLVLAVNKNESEQNMEDLVKLMSQWSSILGLNEVILCGCLDINEEVTPLSINDLRRLKKALNRFAQIKYFDKLQDAIQNIAASINEGEMLVFAGGESMNSARALLEYEVKQESLNKSLQ